MENPDRTIRENDENLWKPIGFFVEIWWRNSDVQRLVKEMFLWNIDKKLFFSEMINKWKFDWPNLGILWLRWRSTRSPGKAEISPTMLRYVWDEININHEKTEVTACDSELEIFTKQNDAKWGSQTCRNNHKGSSTKMGTKKMIPQLANIWRFQLFNHQTSEDPGKIPGKSSMWSTLRYSNVPLENPL
jgi:hypothetical protein